MSIAQKFKALKKWQRITIIVVGVLIAIAIITPSDESSTKSENKIQTDHAAISKPEEVKKPKIEIISKDSKNDEFGSYVYVRVKNNTDKLCSYLDITVTYFDENRKVVGTGYGNTSNFASQTERTVECMAMNIEGAKTYEIQLGNTLFD